MDKKGKKRHNQSIMGESFKHIRKAVFPVAGLGTRFLPATKSVPKEMLTIVDKPILQYAVEEARAAGIEHFVFVTGRGKSVIEDHFDIAFELQETLKARGKTNMLELLQRDLPEPGQVSYTRQQSPLGLGHAVWCARELIGDEPFALLLPDMLVKSDPPCLKTMVDHYNKTGGNIISVEECDPAETHKYGIVSFSEEESQGVYRVNGMVEKPPAGKAPSNYYINGRYILQPEIFDMLSRQSPGAGNEIQLTDAMQQLMKSDQFHAVTFNGKTFDCGSRIGFLEANIAFGMDDPDIAEALRPLLEKYGQSTKKNHDRLTVAK